jgi:RNA polymerase sigma-70 factor (ECF subfamily)
LTVAIQDASGVIARHTRSRNTPSAPSFSEIFEQTAPFVWRVLRHLGVKAADLPDICQEVFVVIHRRLPDFDAKKSSLRTWTYGICLRTASQYRRRAPRLREVPEAEAHEQSVMADQEDELERKRAREWLNRALEQVDADDRTVFVLHELEELPMKEIAVVLGCPVQTGYSKLHRARGQVEKAFRALATEKRGERGG